MNRMKMQWRRVRDYLKSLFTPSGDDSTGDGEPTVGKAWGANRGRFAFPPVLEPALAKIPKN